MRISKVLIQNIFLITLSLIYYACSKNINTSNQYRYKVPDLLNDGINVADVDQVGLSKNYIEDLLEYLDSNTDHKVHSILIIKDNYLVFEEYFNGEKFKLAQYTGESGFNVNDRHNLCSATKSITSSLVGIAVDQGFINSVDDEVYTYFPQYFDIFEDDSIKSTMTIDNLLTMRTGITWQEETSDYENPTQDIIQTWNNRDPIRYMLSKELFASPGEIYKYDNCNTLIAGDLVSQSVGLKLDTFAEVNLFSKLRISDYEWQFLHNDVTYCSGEIRMRPRDMAKFGILYLNEGEWKGEQLISEQWINLSTEIHYQFQSNESINNGYGYYWWHKSFDVNGRKYDSYFADGWGGQSIYIFDEFDLVVVFTGGNYYDVVPNHFLLTNFILLAIE